MNRLVPNVFSPSASILIEKNQFFSKQFRKSALLNLVTSQDMEEEQCRHRLLDSIQVFSDYFQKIVLLRYALCDNKTFLSVSIEHMKEEFGHNLSLANDRGDRPVLWDPVLEGLSSWFTWKMFTLDNDEKVVLIHLVLETSANIFFQAAHKVMAQYNETDYFSIHSEVDEKHEKMGLDLIKVLDQEKLEQLLLIQEQGWSMINTICDQIATITKKNSAVKFPHQTGL